jgi:hypothetical protein
MDGCAEVTMAIGNKIVLSWPPGTGGDFVRSCLYVIMHHGNWEYRQWEEHEEPIDGWTEISADPYPKALVWNNNLISFIDYKGQAQSPVMWKHFRWNEFLEGKKNELGVTALKADLYRLIFCIHKRHHTETNVDQLMEIQNEAYRLDDLNPVVTYICAKDTKYLRLAQENWNLKTHEYNHYIANQEINWWDTALAETIDWRDRNPEKINHTLFEFGDRKHMMFMDSFFEWETFRQELEWFRGFYHNAGCMPVQNDAHWYVVKQFWQEWIDGQKLKVE